MALWSGAALAFVGVFSVVWPICLGFYAYFKATRSHRVLIWLRRFNRREPGRFQFGRALVRACAGMCVPMTLQDSSFRTSYFAGFTRLTLMLPIILGVGQLVVLVSAVLVYVWARQELGLSDAGAIVSAVVTATVLTGLSAVIAKRVLETHGFRTVEARRATDFVRGVLAKIRRRAGLAFGMLVLKTSDDSWKDVVSVCLGEADAVVIDVSELTDNVTWELVTASKLLPPRSIILASASEASQSAQLSPMVEGRLREVFADEIRSEIEIFHYPTLEPPIGPRRGHAYSELSDQIRAAVARAVTSSAKSKEAPRLASRGLAVLRTYLLVLSAAASVLFIAFSVIFGPYNLRNAAEAALGSLVIAALASLPVLGWLFWRERKGTH